jgi:hypothetical protein
MEQYPTETLQCSKQYQMTMHTRQLLHVMEGLLSSGAVGKCSLVSVTAMDLAAGSVSVPGDPCLQTTRAGVSHADIPRVKPAE